MSQLLLWKEPQSTVPPRVAEIRCPLCGQSTGHSAGGCSACPLGRRGCGTLTCPRCDYRFISERRWLARLERWRSRLHEAFAGIDVQHWFGLRRSARIREGLRVEGITGFGEAMEKRGGGPGHVRVSGEFERSLSLLDLRAGEAASVVAMGVDHPSRLAKLSAYGIAPGSRLKVIRTRPAILVEVGGTHLVLDWDVAAGIQIRRNSP